MGGRGGGSVWFREGRSKEKRFLRQVLKCDRALYSFAKIRSRL